MLSEINKTDLKDELKAALQELIIEQPDLFQPFFVAAQKHIETAPLGGLHEFKLQPDGGLQPLIEDNFNRYEKILKTLT
jgi:hypothetical protein